MSYAYIKLLSIMIHSADIKNKKILKLLLHDYAKTIIKKKEIIFLYILLNSYREKTDVFDKPLYKYSTHARLNLSVPFDPIILSKCCINGFLLTVVSTSLPLMLSPAASNSLDHCESELYNSS